MTRMTPAGVFVTPNNPVNRVPTNVFQANPYAIPMGLMNAGIGLMQGAAPSPVPGAASRGFASAAQGLQQGLMQSLQLNEMDRQRQAEQRAQAALAQMNLSPAVQALGQADPMAALQVAAQRPAAPRAAPTRKLSLAGGMVQDQELVGNEWQNVGDPYPRRDPFLQVQGVDEQGRPVTQIVPRADVMAQFTETPQSEDVAVVEQQPGVRRVTVATGQRKKPSKEQAVTEANMGAALQDLDTAQAILFNDQGQLDRKVASAGIAGLPGTRGRTGYQALRRSVEVLLRMRTGAAAPASEVDTYMSLYAPSPLDSNEAARNKMDQLRGIFEQTTDLMTNQQFEYQGGNVPGDLPTETQEAGVSGGGWDRSANLGKWTDEQILSTPQSAVRSMTAKQFDVFERRYRALTGTPRR